MEINTKALVDILEEENQDFSTGDLLLFINCKKCNAMFELNADTVALAVMTNATVWDYIKTIQLSKCKVCNESHPDFEKKAEGLIMEIDKKDLAKILQTVILDFTQWQFHYDLDDETTSIASVRAFCQAWIEINLNKENEE